MMTPTRFLTAAAALCLAAACGGQPPPEPAGPPPSTEGPWLGYRLTDEMIEERIGDRTLYGCFADGAAWAERYNSDGSFQDMQQDGLTVGTWYTTPLDELCFRYTAGLNAGQEPYCFIVSETRDGLHFYRAGVEDYVASTSCPMTVNDDDGYQ